MTEFRIYVYIIKLSEKNNSTQSIESRVKRNKLKYRPNDKNNL